MCLPSWDMDLSHASNSPLWNFGVDVINQKYRSQSRNRREFKWLGSWRSTCLRLPHERAAVVVCTNVFSDVLHLPIVCSHISLARYVSRIPAANEIRRLEELSYDELADKWSNTPFILTRCIQSWPVTKEWDLEVLLRQYADLEFRAEAVDWPFATYYIYMSNNGDESPLNLFDRKFAEKMGIEIGRRDDAAYWKPDCFGPDLFELLGDERPAHRWLIIGPERSGATFHKDPNGTSAWNAVIQGAKYWIMFPPTVAVPGVYVSADNSEVTSPLSIAEWLLEFHDEARQVPGCVEGICQAGEILHVPSGWWHLVVNLERGIALTQNFVPEAHLAEVLSFLRDKPDQVTGFKREVADPYSLFTKRLQDTYPDLLEGALEELDKKNQRTKKRTWESAIGSEPGSGQERAGVSFAFGFADDVDDTDANGIP